MDTVTRRASGAAIADDVGLRMFFNNVLGTMAMGLAFSGLIIVWLTHSPAAMAYFVGGTSTHPTMRPLYLAAIVGYFALGIGLPYLLRKIDLSMTSGLTLFLVFAGFTGIVIAPAIGMYTDASVAKAFFLTGAMFGGSALYGHTTKRDLTSVGMFMIMGLFGLLIASFVNFFLRSPMMDYVLAAVGIVVFTGLTAWYMQELRAMYDRAGYSVELVITGALQLYLHFINLLLYALRLFGERK